jgi:CRP/FNR family transcriptional regulator, dissimilatory nitrate respiration regulator
MITIMSISLRSLLAEMRGQELSYAAGQHIFEQGEPVRQIHVVQSGSTFLIRRQTDGAALVLQRAEAGEVLAEASLYSESYHCAAEAQSASSTWAISKRELRKHLADNGSFAHAWAKHPAHEVQRARLHAEIVSLKTVSARVDAWIAWNGPLPLKGEWANVAFQIGVSPEALYRELARRRTMPQS